MPGKEVDLSTRGKRIATARKALGITQTELAQRLGCSKQAVSKWERDAAEEIHQSLFMKLCVVLGVNTHWLNGGEIDPQPYKKVSIDEAALLETYRQLPEESRDEVARFASYLMSKHQDAPSVVSPFLKLRRSAKV